MSGRKALLIGINYVGSQNELQVGDFEAFEGWQNSHYSFARVIVKENRYQHEHEVLYH